MIVHSISVALHLPGMHSPRAGTGPQTCYISPLEQVTNKKGH